MKEFKEKNIINFIKLAPLIFILLICGIFSYIYFLNYSNDFEKEIKILEAKYIKENKEEIQRAIDRVHKRIKDEQKRSEEKLKKSLKQEVDNAHKIIEVIYRQNKNKSEEEIRKIIEEVFQNVRFNDGRGYFFIYSLDADVKFHPILKHIEGKNLWNYKDARGVEIFKDINKILKKENSFFYTWYWRKTDLEDKKEYKKIGYIKKIESLNWFIGSGEYTDEFDKNLKKAVLDDIYNIRIKDDGYIFVLDYNGTYLNYINKEYIGKNVYDDVGLVNPKIMDDVYNVAQKGGFTEYKHLKKPFSKKIVSKISYVKKIENWDWLIGTGFFMDDFQKDIVYKKELLKKSYQNHLKNFLLVISILTIFLIVISIYISKILKNKFLSYRKTIETKVLENAKKDALLAQQSKMAAMGEMIGNIAHQWRQPLSVISSAATGAKMHKELGISTDEFEIECFDSINRNVQHLSQTIDDFRNFFRPDKTENVFNIKDTLDKVLSLVEVQYQNRNIQLIKNIQECEIKNLENELIQALINILNNARDALYKKEDEKYIFLDIYKNEENLIIEIKDNAGGIKEEIIENIFDLYFTTKKDEDGTGIGLYMTKEIINNHMRGKIEVKNQEFIYNDKSLKGAKFIIKLSL